MLSAKKSMTVLATTASLLFIASENSVSGCVQSQSMEVVSKSVSGRPTRIASLQPLTKSEHDHVQKLVKDLSDRKYVVRESATKELSKLDISVVPYLAKLIEAGDAEQSWRAFRILSSLSLESDQQSMAKVARIFKLLGEHGHPELLAEASRVSQNWRLHQVKKTSEKIRQLGGQVTGFEPSDHLNALRGLGGFGGGGFRVRARNLGGVVPDPNEKSQSAKLRKMRGQQSKLSDEELGSKVDEILASDAEEDFNELRKMKVPDATSQRNVNQVFSGDVVLELAGGELVAAGGPSVVIGKNWQGGSEKLKLLLDLPSPNTLVIQDQKLDDGFFEILAELNVQSLSIHRCEYDSVALRKFAENHERTYLDVKGKALLGVRGPISVATVNGVAKKDCVISEVIAGSAASKAGIKISDKIVEVNGQPIKTFQDLIFEIAGRKIGAEVKVAVERDGEKVELDLKLSDASIADE